MSIFRLKDFPTDADDVREDFHTTLSASADDHEVVTPLLHVEKDGDLGLVLTYTNARRFRLVIEELPPESEIGMTRLVDAWESRHQGESE